MSGERKEESRMRMLVAWTVIFGVLTPILWVMGRNLGQANINECLQNDLFARCTIGVPAAILGLLSLLTLLGFIGCGIAALLTWASQK